jgi:DNA-directed RNA polymerase specialized sigma24 family protein
LSLLIEAQKRSRMTLEEFYPKIDIICGQLCNKYNDSGVEFEDLYQEACVKCLEMLKLDKSTAYVFVSIRNHLINYANKITKEIPIGLIDLEFSPLK